MGNVLETYGDNSKSGILTYRERHFLRQECNVAISQAEYDIELIEGHKWFINPLGALSVGADTFQDPQGIASKRVVAKKEFRDHACGVVHVKLAEHFGCIVPVRYHCDYIDGRITELDIMSPSKEICRYVSSLLATGHANTFPDITRTRFDVPAKPCRICQQIPPQQNLLSWILYHKYVQKCTDEFIIDKYVSNNNQFESIMGRFDAFMDCKD